MTQDEIDAITRGVTGAIVQSLKKRLEDVDGQLALLRARVDAADAMTAALQNQIAPGSKGLRDRLKG